MAAETESGFMIDGVLCEMPGLDTFTMDEAQILYDHSGLTVEDFAPEEGVEPDENGEYEMSVEQEKMLKNPGFMRALLHIAYQRKHPRMNPAKVKALVGSVNVVDLLQQIADKVPGKGDALPPASTNTPEDPSPSSTPGSSESSGSDSTMSSDGQVVPLGRTTTPASDMSSTPSPLAGSAL